jgi:hypothetical protein
MDAAKFSPGLRRYAKSFNPKPPSHLGTRYGVRGGFLPDAGNTIVCHLEKGSETQRAIIESRERYLVMPEAEQFVFTPMTSLHMTLFQGVMDNRRVEGFWPADLPLDTPIEDMTEILAARLEGFEALDPFRVTVVGADPTALVVDGAGENDRKAMRAWRDAFARLFGYQHPDHDDYLYHITFAYPIERLSDAVLPAWQAMLDDVVDAINSRAPELEMTPPAYCVFEDMNHFHEILVFDPEDGMEASDD